MISPILTIFMALLLANICSGLVRKLGMPRAVGQIIAGFILGIPMLKEIFFTTEVVSVFGFVSQIGIILLYYFIGLETSVQSFLKHFDKTLVLASFTTFIPLLGGFIISRFMFGFPDTVSFLIAVVLSISSISVSLDVLEEVKLVKGFIENLLVSIAAVSNIFEFIFISALLLLFRSGTDPNSLFIVLVEILLFTLVVVVARILVIPQILRMFEAERTPASIFMGSMLIVLMMVYLAETLGIGSFIGALMAGIIVRQVLYDDEKNPREEHDIAHSIHLLAFGFFIPLFFVWIGVNTTITALFTNAGLIIALVLMDIVLTVSGTILGYIIEKGKIFDAIVVGFGLVPKGEDTGIVIATLALNSSIITLEVYSAIVFVIFMNTIIAPLVFRQLLLKWKEHGHPSLAKPAAG